MYLIVGLGNPGKEYELTRHNAGFVAVEMLLDKLDSKEKFRKETKFQAEVARNGEIVVIRPTTFMNESGRAVKKIMDFYKLSPSDLIVIHDDLDISLGEYKIQKGVGPKVHNGVDSVEAYVGSKEFVRLRLGVDNRGAGINYGSGADYVLSKMAKEERNKLEMAIELSLGDLAETFGLEFE